MADDEKIVSRIQLLCQELQDMILSSLCEPPARITMTEDYAPPFFLQLNRKLRATYAQQYYSNTSFEWMFETYPKMHDFLWDGKRNRMHYFTRWARNLRKEHRDMVSNVLISRAYHLPLDPSVYTDYAVRSLEGSVFAGGLENADVIVGLINSEGITATYNASQCF